MTTDAPTTGPKTTDAETLGPEKSFALDYIVRNREALACLGDNIFHMAELGMQEFDSTALMSGLLEEGGFTVERNVAGFPTGFVASYGSGAPVVAIHTECDANPDNSQRSGVAERSAIVDGAPGHCEGHNLNAAAMVAAGLAIARAIDRFGLKGTIRLVNAPAEEQLISRPYFVRDGVFDDVDVAIHDHVDGQFRTVYGVLLTAAVSADFTFHGESAHAALHPWMARDALDAVVLMDMGMAQFREHMQPSMTAHRVITHGGDQPNVIPSRATVWWFFRDSTADGARALFEQGKRIAEGAALMTNTTLDVNIRSAVWPLRFNRTMAEVIQRNIEAIGMPGWTAEEDAFARKIQAKAEVEQVGLRPDATPLTGPVKQIPAANDAGDVSWVVPMGRVSFPGNIPGVPYHHWAAGAALATSIGHKGAEAGAKALAASVVDLFLDPDLVAAAKETFREEIGNTPYESMLPADQTPPLELNRALMERYREQLRTHYPAEKPHFD